MKKAGWSPYEHFQGLFHRLLEQYQLWIYLRGFRRIFEMEKEFSVFCCLGALFDQVEEMKNAAGFDMERELVGEVHGGGHNSRRYFPL